MKFLNTVRLIHFLNKLKSIFGSKKILDVNMKYRRRYLLDVDYADVAFDTKWLVSDTRARVGYAIVDKTRI